jgi:hypothetical protein
LADGVTVTTPDIADVVALVPVNAGMEAATVGPDARPIAVLLFDHV